MGCPLCKPIKPPPPPLTLKTSSNTLLGCSTESDPEDTDEIAPPEPPNNFRSRYTLGEVVGTGTFAVVYNCTHKATNEVYAAKIIDKSKLDPAMEASFRKEVDILGKMDSPYIIRCHEFFEDENNFYLVEEFADGGELFDRIAQQEVCSEDDARELVQSLLEAVKYCHDMHVVHRDLKPENILLVNDDDDTETIKLADFGFAVVAPTNSLTRGCGTVGYVAPEILLREKYGKAVDMWSIGVITYILLGGHVPFLGDDDEEEKENIKTCNYEFDYLSFRYVSEQAKSFVSRLLVLDPSVRYTVDDALQDPWIVDPDRTEMHRSLHGGNLTRSMETSPNKPDMKAFDINDSFYGSIGVLAKSMHGVKNGQKQKYVTA